MTRRLRKSVVAIVLAMLSLPLLMALAIIMIANTESGTRWAVHKLASMAPGTLEVSEFDGTLWRGIRFAEISYRDHDWRIDAGALELRFDIVDLVARRVTIREFAADSIAYRDFSAPPEDPEPLDLETQTLPVTIIVEEGRVRELIIASRDETVIEDVAIDNAWFDGRRIRIGTAAATRDEIMIAATNASVVLDGQVPISAALRWQLSDSEWSGRGRVSGSVVELEFDQFVEGPYPATVSGLLSLRSPGEPAVDALINWERWSVGGRLVEDGEARVRGWLGGYTLDVDAAVQVAENLRIAVRGDASGDTERLDSFVATLDATQGHAEASGSLQWAPGLLLQADLRAIDADANALLQGLSGRITGDARLRYDDAGVLGIDTRLAVGENRLQAKGTLASDQMAIALDIDVAQLDLLTEAVSGSVDGSGSLTGMPADPVLALDLRGSDIRVGDGPAPALDVTLSGNMRPADAGFVSVIDKATIAEPASGMWTLSQPTEVRFRDSAIGFAAHTWSGTNGRIDVKRLDQSPDATAIVAVVDDIPLSIAGAWLPDNVQALGTAEADVDLMRNGDVWSGTATWRQNDTVLRVIGDDDEQTDVRIPLASAEARLDGGTVTAEADLAIEPGVTARLETSLASLSRESAFSAGLQVQGDNWSWVSAVVPQIDRIEGAVGASITATGTLAAPDFVGTLEWRDGSLLVPILNVPFEDIDVVVTGDKLGAATLQGSARAGDGSLTVNGRFSDLMSPSRSLQLRFGGESAELINWPEYRIWATPDIEITVDRAEWRVDGEVTMPKADIVVRKLPEEAVTVSPDVRVLGDEAPTEQANRLGGEARLNLGERVHINALGLDSDLRGSLLLRKRPGREPTAEGRISLVNGSFTAYGRKLAIREGTLTFTGPLNDPIVDVRAVRSIETIDGPVIAGLHLTGRAQTLTATVFSEPAMTDADALSYLVVGRPLNQATEAESRDLSGAAVALGLRQANRLVDQIGQSIGLDQLALTGDGGESTALVAGKQLNRRLYARYSYGVFSRLGAFLLRYRMSEKLTLEAATGENHSIDVVYSIETP